MLKFAPIALVALASGVAVASEPVQTREILSPVYTIDKIYRSMEGPQTSDWAFISPDGPAATPELVWITGFKTEMVKPDGTPSLPEFMCHVNLDLDLSKHYENFPSFKSSERRIMTLSQGQLDVQFPPGLGWPVMSNENMQLTTQVLNLNDKNIKDLQVRHKVTFSYHRDQDLAKPIKPLFNTACYGYVPVTPLEKDGLDMGDGTKIMACTNCLPEMHAPNAAPGSIFYDSGVECTGHWVVPPGRQEGHNDVTSRINLPYDTTLHYAAIHVHPYCESVELYDKTAKKSVFKSKAINPVGKMGLDHVEPFSSAEGVMMYKDHKYELRYVYNNPTDKNSDAMVAVVMFLEDKTFEKPVAGAKSTAQSGPVGSNRPINEAAVSTADVKERIVLKTSAGDLKIRLFPDVAPETAKQFTDLVKAGAYDTAVFHAIAPGFYAQVGALHQRTTPMTQEQQSMLRMLPLEPSRIPHTRGVLSMARDPANPDSGETSFCIMLGDAPQLDTLYTVFGIVEESDETLANLEKPRAEGMTAGSHAIESGRVFDGK